MAVTGNVAWPATPRHGTDRGQGRRESVHFRLQAHGRAVYQLRPHQGRDPQMETHEAPGQKVHGRARGAAVESAEKEKKTGKAERGDAPPADGERGMNANLQRR